MGTLINLHKKTLENKQAALMDLQKQIDGEQSGIDKHVFYIPVQKGYEGEGIRKFISIYENEIGNEITFLFKKEIT